MPCNEEECSPNFSSSTEANQSVFSRDKNPHIRSVTMSITMANSYTLPSPEIGQNFGTTLKTISFSIDHGISAPKFPYINDTFWLMILNHAMVIPWPIASSILYKHAR